MPSKMPLSGGLTLTKPMMEILKQPGPLTLAKGGQRLRTMYSNESSNFNLLLVSEFAQACFVGQLDAVADRVTRGVININGTETPFKYGYATFVVLGAQRVRPGPDIQHIEVLQYLLSSGMNPEVEDIVGFTALDHTTSCPVERADLVRVLLAGGCDVNHQARYGDVALFGAYFHNLIDTIEVLLEFGADLNIAEADGHTPMSTLLTTGPQVTAVVQKWIRRRAGEEAPRDGKQCNQCGDDSKGAVSLKVCSRCKVAQYCSTTCQRAHWRTHKPTCQPFSTLNIVILKPYYDSLGEMIPIAALTRAMMGGGTGVPPEAHSRTAHTPKDLSTAKDIIIKVQVALNEPFGDMLVYTKKRDFVSTLRRAGQGNPAGFDRLDQVIRARGVGGAKAYFAAELRSKDELAIKVSEVLAEQPF